MKMFSWYLILHQVKPPFPAIWSVHDWRANHLRSTLQDLIHTAILLGEITIKCIGKIESNFIEST